MKTTISIALAAMMIFSASQAMSVESDLARKARAKADAVAVKIEKACAKDVSSLCSSVTPGEGRLLMCMLAHEDKVSDGCFDALFATAQQIELAVSNVFRAASVCGPEVEKLCTSTEPGEGRVVACVKKKKTELSSSCRAELAGISARLK